MQWSFTAVVAKKEMLRRASMGLKFLLEGLQKWNITNSGIGFRFLEIGPMGDVLDTFCYTDGIFLKVDILPLQCKDLALAQSCKESDERKQPWVVGCENTVFVLG